MRGIAMVLALFVLAGPANADGSVPVAPSLPTVSVGPVVIGPIPPMFQAPQTIVVSPYSTVQGPMGPDAAPGVTVTIPLSLLGGGGSSPPSPASSPIMMR